VLVPAATVIGTVMSQVPLAAKRVLVVSVVTVVAPIAHRAAGARVRKHIHARRRALGAIFARTRSSPRARARPPRRERSRVVER